MDRGTREPVGDPRTALAAGKLMFHLPGEKLAGLWELVRISKPDDKQDQWMLFKKRDEWAQPLAKYDVIKALPDSVIKKPLGLLEEREPKVVRPVRKGIHELDLSAAISAPLPAKLEPQRATLASSLPTGGDWIVESKLDGYRMLARVDKGRVRLFTSGGHDWTKKLASLAAEAAKLPVPRGWLDGEIVVLRNGLPDFALQNAIDGAANEEIIYFLFDLPYFEGKDLRNVPLWARRALLSKILKDEGDRIRFSQDFDAPVAQIFEAAAGLGLEGLMLKRRDASYESGRTQTWLTAKYRLRQELVVCGEVGSLLLGYYVGNQLHDAGSVGTGWNAPYGSGPMGAPDAVIDTNRLGHMQFKGCILRPLNVGRLTKAAQCKHHHCTWRVISTKDSSTSWSPLIATSFRRRTRGLRLPYYSDKYKLADLVQRMY